MELNVQAIAGGSAGTVAVPDAVFGGEFNESLVHQVVVAHMAAGRAGTRKQKTRAEVRGGGAKPWKQKGSGRARAGTIRSPLWRTGGRTFAARPQDHSQKVNKKMYRGALRAILAELVRQERLLVVDQFDVELPKTRDLLSKLQGLGVNGKVLIIGDDFDVNVFLAARNVRDIDVRHVSEIDPVSLVGNEQVVFTKAALQQYAETLA